MWQLRFVVLLLRGGVHGGVGGREGTNEVACQPTQVTFADGGRGESGGLRRGFEERAWRRWGPWKDQRGCLPACTVESNEKKGLLRLVWRLLDWQAN